MKKAAKKRVAMSPSWGAGDAWRSPCGCRLDWIADQPNYGKRSIIFCCLHAQSTAMREAPSQGAA